MEKFVILKAVRSHILNFPQKRNISPENFKARVEVKPEETGNIPGLVFEII